MLWKGSRESMACSFRLSCVVAMTALWLLAWLPLEAAQLTLVSGEVVEGQILEQNERTVTVRTVKQTLTFPRSRIKQIDEGAPGSVQLLQAVESLRKGDLELARRMVEAARKEGASEADLEAATVQIRRREAEVELAKYSGLIAQAKESARRGQDSEALRELNELLTTLPQDNAARPEIISIVCAYHLNRAEEFRDRVQTQLAIAELNRVIELDPRMARAYVELADIYTTSSGTWNKAIEYYDRAVVLEGADLEDMEKARIRWQQAEIFRQQSSWGDAVRSYVAAYRLSPAVNARIIDRILDMTKRHADEIRYTQTQQALAEVDEALGIREDTDLLMQRGSLLRRLQLFDESNEAYAKALLRTPALRMANYEMAQNHFSKGEILAGRELLMKEVTLFPNNYDALCQLGDFALQRDDYEQAQNFYSSARDLDPDKPRASLGLGRAYRQRGELQQARMAVTEVLARLPDNREATLEMGKILRDENNLEEAATFFTKVLELIDNTTDPKDRDELKPLKADALIARGEISLLTTGPGTANIDFRKALEVLPDYPQAFYSIGTGYRKKFASSKRIEDLKTAEENLLKARSLAPENPQFAIELGIMYQQQFAQADPGNAKDYLEKAIFNYRKYIELGGANAPQVEGWIQDIGT